MNFCALDGYLVTTQGTIPTDPCDYQIDNLPIVGCNHLRCRQCGAAVRNLPKLDFRKEPAAGELPQLYEDSDLATSPLLRPSAGGRLYLCRCRQHLETSESAIGEPDREWNRVLHLSSWHCEGHPSVTMPHDFDGAVVTSEHDLVELATRSLHGILPQNARPEDQRRACWTARLYGRLAQTPWRDTVVRTAAACLTDPEPNVRARAMDFFFCLELGAPRAIELLDGDRQLFVGVRDEITAVTQDKTLEDTLFRVITPLVKEPGRARDLARAEALAHGKGRRSLYDALAANDSEWFIAHVEGIARATPALGKDLIDSCTHRLPRDVASKPVIERIRTVLPSSVVPAR